MTRTTRNLTKREINKIRKLSKDYLMQDIAEIIGVSRTTISNAQDNPKNNIINPRRKYVITNKYKKQGKVIEGYFDIEQWGKIMSY